MVMRAKIKFFIGLTKCNHGKSSFLGLPLLYKNDTLKNNLYSD